MTTRARTLRPVSAPEAAYERASTAVPPDLDAGGGYGTTVPLSNTHTLGIRPYGGRMLGLHMVGAPRGRILPRQQQRPPPYGGGRCASLLAGSGRVRGPHTAGAASNSWRHLVGAGQA